MRVPVRAKLQGARKGGKLGVMDRRFRNAPGRKRIEVLVFRRGDQRIVVLALLFALLGVLLIAGLGYRQLVQGQQYAEAEQRQSFRRILTPGPRGNIFDRDGRLLVGNRPVFSAVVYLNELRPAFRERYWELAAENPSRRATRASRQELQVDARAAVVQDWLDRVNAVLGTTHTVDRDALERHFQQQLLLPFTLVDDLPAEGYAQLVATLPVEAPVQIRTGSARYYPHGRLAAHTLGFVSRATETGAETPQVGDDLLTFREEGKVGRAGIERAFNEHLRGESGLDIWVVDPSGFQHERAVRRAPRKGQDLYLSLDLDLQQAAEEALAGYTGALVALDVRTGEVLALASLPAYDLNALSPVMPLAVKEEIDAAGAWLNRAVQGLYPPGSTFKAITALAALRAGADHIDEEVMCTGYYTVGNRRFPCNHRAGHGMEDLEGALRDSCNIYFYVTALEAGPTALADEARRFGLAAPLGLEIPVAADNAIIPDPAWKRQERGAPWYDGDTANVSIGQGYLRTTPLHMAAFTASLARGEVRTPVTLIRVDAARTVSTEPVALAPEALARVREGMRQAALIGTARLGRLSGIGMAAKTGTAQVYPGGVEMNLAWFIGYAPLDEPEIAVCVVIEGTDADDRFYGGSTAAPVAREVFARWFAKHPYQPPEDEVARR